MTEREIEDSLLRKLGAALMLMGVAAVGFVVGLWKGENEKREAKQ